MKNKKKLLFVIPCLLLTLMLAFLPLFAHFKKDNISCVSAVDLSDVSTLDSVANIPIPLSFTDLSGNIYMSGYSSYFTYSQFVPLEFAFYTDNQGVQHVYVDFSGYFPSRITFARTFGDLETKDFYSVSYSDRQSLVEISYSRGAGVEASYGNYNVGTYNFRSVQPEGFSSSYSLDNVSLFTRISGWNSYQFDGNPVRYVLKSEILGPYSTVVTDTDDVSTLYGVRTVLHFYDVNNNYFAFQFFGLCDTHHFDYDYFALDRREVLLTTSLNDNSIYNSGFNSGYYLGKNDGISEGYNDGYNMGYDIGFSDGHLEGIEDSNQYTFLSLMGSVIDAPIQAFTGLLNFEILGINILGFVTGLLTFAIIILVVKLFFGGK